MTHNQQLVIIFAALLTASPALAHTVVETTTQLITGMGDNSSVSETFSFPEIANADELISISNGYVFFAEGGNLSIFVHYKNGASSQIFSSPYTDGDFTLTSVTRSPFAPGAIDGFTFNVGAYGYNQLSIPSGTAFDIDVSVPEPAGWVTMLAGFGLVGAVMRSTRRTRRVRGGDLRPELRILA